MELPNDTDYALLLACRAGDADAWEQVFTKYERLVFSIPLNYGLSREDAADITQLTFTSLIQSLQTLREDSRLGAWLATVARRYTWRVIERTRRETVGAFETFEQLDESAALFGGTRSNPMERWELLEWLNHGLETLNERCRTLLLALYFAPAEPAYADVAAQLGVPVGSIGPTRARCLERLKQTLEA